MGLLSDKNGIRLDKIPMQKFHCIINCTKMPLNWHTKKKDPDKNKMTDLSNDILVNHLNR